MWTTERRATNQKQNTERSINRSRADAQTSTRSGHEQGIRIHWRAFPPLLHVARSRDREVEMRQVGWCVAGGPYGAEDLATLQRLPFGETVRVAVQMRVHQDEVLARVGGVHHVSSRLAVEQLE